MNQYDNYQCQECGLPTGEICVGQGGATCTCHVVVSEPKYQPECDYRAGNKSHRFRPRLVLSDQCLVQVHPETIEVFNKDGEYLCQVRWIDDKMDYHQGGLPLVKLEKMFRKANP